MVWSSIYSIINMRKRKKVILSIFLLISVLIIYIFFNYTLVDKCTQKGTIGIIDTNLSRQYDNVIYNSTNSVNYSNKKTHGDSIINFINDLNFNGNIYYYSALSSNNTIDSESIIEGLNWMLNNNIHTVNISLSSKYYSEDIQKWINNHPEVNIYASYNNNYNDKYDYPAIYEKVIASGTDKRIHYKKIDKKYRNNKLIIVNSSIKYYHGNSYLSILTMIKGDD